MIEFIMTMLKKYGIPENLIFLISVIIIIGVVILVSFILNKIAQYSISKVVNKFVYKTKNKLDEQLYEMKLFHRLAHIIPAIVIYTFAGEFGAFKNILQKICLSYIVIIVVITISMFLSALEKIYRQYDFSKQLPIKGYIQVLYIVFSIIGGVFLVIIFTGSTAAWALLTSIGGLSAIILLVFKDSILGLIAGIQLTFNRMLKIGDWIEVPQFYADGEVIDVTINTVKVQNWNHTITTIPAYSLVTKPFINWENMGKTGGRRIKRSINIDMNSIGFCSEEMIDKLSKNKYISEYLMSKQKELGDNNNSYINNIENNKKLTNIGVFRIYLQSYIDNHPMIHKGYTKMVRQLAPTEKGLPIEIYAFIADTQWINYENIQGDIFDHILAVIPEFELKIFQQPTGKDINELKDFRNN